MKKPKSNFGGKSPFDKLNPKETATERMARYDALPREYRDVLKQTLTNLYPNDAGPVALVKTFPNVSRFKSWIKQKELLATRDTYGRNHPDVQY